MLAASGQASNQLKNIYAEGQATRLQSSIVRALPV